MQIEEFLERSCHLYPNKVALVCGGERWTYRQLERAANQLASELIEQGVGRWDRVAIYLDNSVESVISIFAILKIDAVFVLLSPGLKQNRLIHLLDHCRSLALITDAIKLERIGGSLCQTPHLRVVVTSGISQYLPGAAVQCVSLQEMRKQPRDIDGPPNRQGIDADPAALIYTSGSTGDPKGIILTHLNFLSAITSITAYLKNTPQDIILNVLPLSFSYGLTQLLTAFHSGATLVLQPSYNNPYEVLRTITREQVTGFGFVPTIASSLLEVDLRQYDLSSLRFVTNASAALPIPTIRKLREILPHVEIFPMYGLAECIRVSYLPPDQIDVRPDSIGRGLPNQEIYLVDAEGRRLAPGMIGEMVVRGSNVMRGYWELPEETERMLRPGPFPGEKVLHTGDLFRMDDSGYFYFVGRKDGMIKTCGHKVIPEEIEKVLYSLDAIAEAAVVGVPDKILGQAIKAVVRLKENAKVTRKDIVRHCAQYLEDFMVPTLVEFRDSFPKTHSEKIRKRELVTGSGATSHG
jgi:amino acid adenylation domain-containing protein